MNFTEKFKTYKNQNVLIFGSSLEGKPVCIVYLPVIGWHLFFNNSLFKIHKSSLSLMIQPTNRAIHIHIWKLVTSIETHKSRIGNSEFGTRIYSSVHRQKNYEMKSLFNIHQLWLESNIEQNMNLNYKLPVLGCKIQQFFFSFDDQLNADLIELSLWLFYLGEDMVMLELLAQTRIEPRNIFKRASVGNQPINKFMFVEFQFYMI